MKKIVRILLFVLVAAACAVGGFYYMSIPVAVEAVNVVPDTAHLYITEKGIVENRESVAVYPAVSGKVLDVVVEKGQYVNAGDAICVIDASGARFDIDEARAQIRSLEAQKAAAAATEQARKDELSTNRGVLEKELAGLDARENTSELTQQDIERQKDEQLRLQNIVIEQNEKEIDRAAEELAKARSLYESGVLAQREVLALQDGLAQLEARLEENVQQLALIEAGATRQTESGYYEAARDSLREQMAGIDSSLGKDYSRSVISGYDAQIEALVINIGKLEKLITDAAVIAPVAGVVAELPAKQTNMASAASPVAVLDAGENFIAVHVATKDMSAVYEGAHVEIIIKRRDGDLVTTGVVADMEREANIIISSLGVEERKVKVYVRPEDPSLFGKGYDADVRFTLARAEDALIVPKTAVFWEEDGYKVWRVADGRLEKAAITRGLELRSGYVAEHGLAAGDVVVKDSALETLKPGLKVETVL